MVAHEPLVPWWLQDLVSKIEHMVFAVGRMLERVFAAFREVRGRVRGPRWSA
jgi:hypothetical protein